MVEGKTEFPELKAESFQVVECLDEDVDIDLFSKAVISVVGDEHHGHPVVASVTRNLFRATTNYIYHAVFFPVAPLEGRRMPAACDKKEIYFSWRKKDATFHLRVFHFVSDHAVFPVATIRKK